MPETNQIFGGGVAETTMNPIVLMAILIGIVFTLALPRKYVMAPMLLGIFLVPIGQSVYAFGAHWLAYRIVVVGGLARVMVMKVTWKRPLFAGGLTAIDRAFIGTVLCQTVALVLLHMEAAAFINRLGFLIDFLGAYVVLRVFIQDEADVYRTLKWLAFITVIVAIGMAVEQVALKNVFGLLGGTRVTPEIREGRIRSQGVFQHSITAGTFGATLLVPFLLLWRAGKSRLAAGIGIAGCTLMTIFSNSSTPLLAYVAGIVGVCLWPLRKQMRTVGRCSVVGLIVLHLVMKAPVWFLIARVDLTGSSSGYHRAEVVDQCISHFREWWLLGAKDSSLWGFDMWDVQNQFVAVAETGGLLALILFVLVLSRTFGLLGVARKTVEGNRSKEWIPWLLGCTLFAHTVAFFGANYFDQSKVGFFLSLAMVPAIAIPMCIKNRTVAVARLPAITQSDLELAHCG